MRLCKDCKHSECRGFERVISNWYCVRNAGKDPVIGEYETGVALCGYFRDTDGSCKPEGIFWEPK